MFEAGVPIREFGSWDSSHMLAEKHDKAVREDFEDLDVASAVINRTEHDKDIIMGHIEHASDDFKHNGKVSTIATTIDRD